MTMIGIILAAVLLILGVMKAVQDRDIKTVDEQILEELKISEKEIYTIDKRRSVRNKNRKIRLITDLLLILFIVLFILLAFMYDADNIAIYLLVGGVVYIIAVFMVHVFIRKDNNKLLDKRQLYVIKSYVKMVTGTSSGARGIFVYYDYIQKKHIIKSARADSEIQAGAFEEIVVAKEADKLQFVAFKKRIEG